MSSISAMTRWFTRPACLLVLGLLSSAVFVSIVLLTGGGASAATVTPSYAGYPALSSVEPTGLPLVSRTSGTANGITPAATGPTFPANPPADLTGDWPVATSIRKVSVDVPTVSAWISKSIDGGVCVLSSRHQPINGLYGVAFSCAPTAGIDSGATVESEVPDSSNVTAVGVVPAGVSSVQVTLTNGTTKTVAVSGNAWALETDSHIQSANDVAGG
jgi:hypothetical protein